MSNCVQLETIPKYKFSVYETHANLAFTLDKQYQEDKKSIFREMRTEYCDKKYAQFYRML